MNLGPGGLYLKPEGFAFWQRLGEVKDVEFHAPANKVMARYNPIVLRETEELSVIEQLRMYCEHYGPLKIQFNAYVAPGQVWFNEGVFIMNEAWAKAQFSTFDAALLKSMGVKP